MRRGLEERAALYHMRGGARIRGPRPGLRGATHLLTGDCSGVTGIVQELRGDVTGLTGDLTGLKGNLSDCELTDEDRTNGVDVAILVRGRER